MTPQEILRMQMFAPDDYAAMVAEQQRGGPAQEPQGAVQTPEGLASLARGLGQGPMHEQATRIAWGLESGAGASPEVMQRVADIRAGKYNTVEGPHPLMKLGFGAIMGGGALSALNAGLGAGAAGAAGGASAGGTAGGLGAASAGGSSLLGAELAAPVSIAEMNAAFPGLAAGGAGGGAGLLAAETAAPVPYAELQAAFPGGLSVPGGAGALSGASSAPAGGGALGAGIVPGTASTAAGGLSSILSNPQALGALGGLALGGLGGSKQAGTITVEEGIPDWLQPYVKPQLDKYSSLVQNYQTDPYGVMPEAMKQFKNTISGQFLDPSTNKYLEQYFNLGAERVKGSLSPSFGHMQAFGSHTGYNEALSRGLGDLATNLYGGAYERERDRQNQMTAAAPGFLQAGSQQAFAPYTQYLNTVGNLGKKKEQPYFDNPFGNMLGGAMMGYGLGGLFK